MADEPPFIGADHRWHRAGIPGCVCEGEAWCAPGDKCDCEQGNQETADE